MANVWPFPGPYAHVIRQLTPGIFGLPPFGLAAGLFLAYIPFVPHPRWLFLDRLTSSPIPNLPVIVLLPLVTVETILAYHWLRRRGVFQPLLALPSRDKRIRADFGNSPISRWLWAMIIPPSTWLILGLVGGRFLTVAMYGGYVFGTSAIVTLGGTRLAMYLISQPWHPHGLLSLSAEKSTLP